MSEIFDLNNFEDYYKKNLVLEASAGTGKTYSVTNIITKLVDKGIDIKKILVVTYTEKATGELKDRIRKELINNPKVNVSDLDNLNIYTIHSFCQNSIKEFGLKAKQPLSLDVIDESEEIDKYFDRYVRDSNILIDIDYMYQNGYEIKIDDLKKYFKETISKYYLDFNGSLDNDIIGIEYSAVAELFKQTGSLDNYTFDYIYENNIKGFKDAFDLLALKSDVNLKTYLEYMKRMFGKTSIPKRIYYSNFPFTLDEKNAYEYFLSLNEQKFMYHTINDAISMDLDFKNNYDILVNSDIGLAVISNVNEFKYNNKIKFKKTFDKKTIFSSLKTIEENDALSIVENICMPGLTSKDYHECLVSKYIDDFYLSFQKEKEKNHQQSFNDMLRTIRETILINEDFKKALKDKYVYGIIDEFQDTNQLQFDTFREIFLTDNNHNLIVVGDPKQSIYSFQGADLDVYLKAKEIIGNEGEIYRLSTNYRSSKKMIESCNKFFMTYQDENDNDLDFFTNPKIEFSSSMSPSDNKKKITYDGIDIKPIWIGMNKDLENEEDKNLDITPNQFAKVAVRAIIDSVTKVNGKTKLQINGRNVSFADFTVLARSRSEMQHIERELKRYGIPYIKYKDTNLFSSDECKNWAILFEAINKDDFTGKNRAAFRKALFTVFFGKSLEEINSKYYTKDDSLEMKLILKWKEITKTRRWEDLIDSVFVESKILKRLGSLNKLQSLTLYKQIGDYCISYLYDNHTISDLINKLNGQEGLDSDDDDSSTVEIGTDLHSVKLMTIHASKGLQFPIVISVAGYKAPFNQIKAYTYHNDNRERKICYDSKKALKDLIGEWERLIYVAYTRAEYLMIIPYYKVSTNNYFYDTLKAKTKIYMDNNSSDYRKLYMNDLEEDELKRQVKLAINDTTNNDGISFEEQKKNIKEIIKNENKKKSFKHSYSSLSHPKDNNETECFIDDFDKEGFIEDDLKQFDTKSMPIYGEFKEIEHIDYSKIPRGASIGTMLHEVFERLDFTNYEKDLDTIILDRLKANKIPVKDLYINYIKQIVSNVLEANLVKINGNNYGDSFKLNSISNENKKPEIEFNFNLLNGRFKNYCNGFIDLLFKRGEYYSILDWKSDTLNDDEFISYYDSNSLHEHTNIHYSIQRVLYSYCLIKWLSNYYKESEEDIFNNHFGGIYYVYIRGCLKDSSNGIYSQTWNSYKDLEEAFNTIIKSKIGGK